MYPVIPGHEIIGRVRRVGGEVKGFKVGGIAGGLAAWWIRACADASCKIRLEQYRGTAATVFTYNSPDKHLPGKMTYGG